MGSYRTAPDSCFKCPLLARVLLLLFPVAKVFHCIHVVGLSDMNVIVWEYGVSRGHINDGKLCDKPLEPQEFAD
jgi:hypothetical protein